VHLYGFSLRGGSAWVAGSCLTAADFSCSGPLASLISSNAYQPQPSGTSDTVLIDLTNISTSISFVGSAASGTSPFAAGELISIYGSQLGPAVGVGGQLSSSLVVGTSAGDTQVLFDGIPAPILFARTDIVNTAIPCEVAGHASTQLVVEYLGVQSPPMTIPLVPAAPAVFTANSSGSGPGLVFNSDYSLNTSANPAARGSAVFFYATGIGPMSPACVDGLVYTSTFPSATLPVIAGVGNLGAQVLYAGQAPDLMAGVAQINIVVPTDAATGVVPLTLLVNGVFSPSGVTLAVK
jgi:uncharacterized protein (TIGR03437 family)